MEGSKSRTTFFPFAASGIAHFLEILWGGGEGKIERIIQEEEKCNWKTTNTVWNILSRISQPSLATLREAYEEPYPLDYK